MNNENINENTFLHVMEHFSFLSTAQHHQYEMLCVVGNTKIFIAIFEEKEQQGIEKGKTTIHSNAIILFFVASLFKVTQHKISKTIFFVRDFFCFYKNEFLWCDHG